MNIHRLIRRILLSALALAAAALVASLAATHVSTASAKPAQKAASENWAGYDVTGQQFSSVSGSWIQPRANANAGSSQGYSAFWVGLGGSSSGSRSLEQVGTASSFVDGHTQYSAWYELVPLGQVKLNITIHPGDKISGKVAVNGNAVTVSLSDRTTGDSVVKTLQMSSPDTSSAEWIAEAPATETFDGNYRILPLADFGKVTFTDAVATAGEHTGGIADSHWSATRIQLQSGTRSPTLDSGFPGFAAGPSLSQATSGATTSKLSGDSFSVAWQAASDSPSSSVAGGSPSDPAEGQFPAFGNPPG